MGRFRSERQILATLEHPNIAKLLDGGTTDDGRPYLVMELIDGLPIDTYAATKRLTVRNRLRLVIKVCRAVQFAHQNLVVHRDLKPANILITSDGEPKLLDFGIAKLLSPDDFPQTVQATGPGFLPMTPAYASPEQVRGDAITTATDVYAFGVLLYELLAGQRPYEVDRARPQEAMRAICEVDPPRPSTVVPASVASAGAATPAVVSPAVAGPGPNLASWRRHLAGDLDSIVLKALNKEPTKRYASAAELEQDLERHLNGLPVAARDATWRYRSGKFVKRHRLGLGVAAAAVVATVTFVVMLLVQRGEILAQQSRGELVISFLTEMFAFPDPSRAMVETITAREILERGARRIETELTSQPTVQADLQSTMGRTFLNLGLHEEAEKHLLRALALQGKGNERKSALARATTLHGLANLRLSKSDFAHAEQRAREALALRRRWLGSRHADVVLTLITLGRIHDLAGDRDSAAAEFTEALEHARKLDNQEPLAIVLDRFAQLRTTQARHAEASALFTEALQVQRDHFGARHPTVAVTLNNFSTLFDVTGDYARAEALLREALEIQRVRYDDPHPHLAFTLHNLGRLAERGEHFDEAQTLYQEALDLRRAIFRGPHPKIASTLRRIGRIAHIRGDLAEAERLFQESIAMLEAVVGDDHLETADSYALYALLLVKRGAFDEAESLFQKVLAIRRDTFGDQHSELAVTLANLADLNRARRDYGAASELYQEALALAIGGKGENHPDVAGVRYGLGLVQRHLGQLDSAADNLERAEQGLRSTLGNDHGHVAQCLLILAMVEIDRDQPAVAERLAREARAIYGRGASHPNRTANAVGVLGKSLFAQQRYAETEPLLLASYQHYLDTRGPTSGSTTSRLGQLIALYEAWDKPAKVAEFRARMPPDS